jgi:hypothetical protein
VFGIKLIKQCSELHFGNDNLLMVVDCSYKLHNIEISRLLVIKCFEQRGELGGYSDIAIAS